MSDHTAKSWRIRTGERMLAAIDRGEARANAAMDRHLTPKTKTDLQYGKRTLGDVTLYVDRIAYRGENHSLAGVRASVGEAAHRESWVTGGFHDVYLTITGPDFEWVVSTSRLVEGSRKEREFAAEINTRAGRLRRATPPASAVVTPPVAPAGPVEQLAQLAELHRAGALTDVEFSAAKARLLGLS